jgi:hypothetical protein
MNNDGITSMMEKSGSPIITESDLILFHQGVVSDRLQDSWGFTLTELAEAINSNFFTLQEN